MQIREAEVFSFGKLKEQKISFEPGINVIYGANEAGKSTLHAFLIAMLFGMEKGRGRGSTAEGYQRYEPWHAPSYYSGALRFDVDGRPFYLERNFYHREKRDFLRNEVDGEELSVAYGDLTMLLGGIHKETFGNTYDISQSGAVTGKELADSLAEYLSDAAESGSSGFRVKQAVDMLKEKKRILGVEQKKLQGEKEQSEAALRMEQELLQRDCLKLREDIAWSSKQMAAMPEQNTNKDCRETRFVDENHETKNSRMGIWMFIPAIVLFFGMVWSLVKAGGAEGGQLQVVIAGVLGIGALGAALYGLRSIRRKENRNGISLPQQEAKEEVQEANSGLNHAKQMLGLLQESLDEKETRLYNISEQLEQLRLQTDEEREVQQEIEAVQLAADELERLARELCEEAGDTLNSEVSRYISAITDGKYDSVRVDENGKLWAMVEGREISPEVLSRGTLEQFYLALRLAVGKTVTGEEAMPIFLDDAFVWYDDHRLQQVLKVLSKTNTQVLLFTCQKREMNILSEMGQDFNFIHL